MFIVTVKDRAVDAFGTPFVVRATGEATRSFIDEIHRDGSPMGQHPEDYDLYMVGQWDERTGELIPSSPKLLMRGQDVPPSVIS